MRSKSHNKSVTPELSVDLLLHSPSISVRDIYCAGTCKGHSPEEHATATELVFPYRGTYVRHVGQDQSVAEANQVLLFNRGQGYRVSHPVEGGDASLSLFLSPSLLAELSPVSLLIDRTEPTFHAQRLRVDTRSQSLLATLRHRLRQGVAASMEAETLALTLVQHTLGPRTAHTAGGSAGRQRLVDRAKLAVASDLGRRWTLAEVAAEVRCSPVYLTQVFQQVEGIPLYRYQLRLRLARALDLLEEYDDLTQLSLDLGFSSHSHFSAAFRETYGKSPSAFKQSALGR
ncbi:helix-turn-helix transcriptional regulator [Terriglobus albidus]|uniref:Helix-turn-helix transcriptional regulator n=1 Tax=Terriglobus albidus TaxID=1592106 RepID=A0A5B9E7Y8_9BACT|nr:AraC family transcriptional regulator [Terriglobus albidus]QEE26740.1 helix-turn-helix transcriptional regulator [Terriglobus albidus]